MTNNMYRVGDYVYFETSSTSPYQIRRIEELNKTPSGNVEAKVMCFYRRRDVSSSLILLADKHQTAIRSPQVSLLGALEEDDIEDAENGFTSSTTSLSGEVLNQEDRHQLRHRELFLSRQIETLPATHIRGKCTVTLLNETEALLSYLNKDDTFFYSLVYDPQQKTLLADKGEIRVGSRYQSDITNILKEGEDDGRKMEDLEQLVWTPNHGLTDRQIDQFLVISRSVGTFARALDCSSSVKQPSLHMSAAAASRDVTLFHAMDTLHKHHYDLSKAVCSLVPSSGPVLCRDEMEEWSASEANLFEEALEKYGKDFNDIRQDFLPWKTLKNIIEYYYMWKTTDRYVQQKRVKAVEAESKLKQVYIPNYNKPNPAVLTNGKNAMVNGNGSEVHTGKPCESCQASSSSQWYGWGPSHMHCRLCNNCWQYWKKFGGLKVPSRVAREEERMSSGGGGLGGGTRVHKCSVGGCSREYKTRSQLMRHAAQAHGITLRPGSPRPIMKTRNAFFLHTSLATRIMRRLCFDIILPRKLSRNPTWPINPASVRQESMLRLDGRSFDDLTPLVKSGTGKRSGKVADVSIRLGQNDRLCPGWMLPTDVNRIPKQAHIAYPKPPKGPDGSLIYTPVPNKEITTMNSSSSILKRRAYEETNGMDALPPHKKSCKDPAEALDQYHLSQLGVNPPPGLTVTPVGLGVNGGPISNTVEAVIPPLPSSHLQPPPLQQPLPAPPQNLPPPPPPPPAVPTQQQQPLPSHSQPLHSQTQLPPQLQSLPSQQPLPPPPPPHGTVMSATPTHSGGGRAKIATVSRIAGRPRIISWMDAPDDVYFYASDITKKLRRTLTTYELKRAARRPFRKVSCKEEPTE